MVNPIIPATDFFLAIWDSLPQPVVALMYLAVILFVLPGIIRLFTR